MGQTIVIVEEKIDFALDFADRYAVLNGGRIVAEGQSADLEDRSVLSASYLG
jgi:ABC-type branched-subunit amino acid transport system ATPase component